MAPHELVQCLLHHRPVWLETITFSLFSHSNWLHCSFYIFTSVRHWEKKPQIARNPWRSSFRRFHQELTRVRRSAVKSIWEFPISSPCWWSRILTNGESIKRNWLNEKMFHSEFRFFFKSTNTGCKYGDVLAAFWGRTLLAMVCRNQVLTIGTRVLEMGSLSRPIQHRYFCACIVESVHRTEWKSHCKTSYGLLSKVLKAFPFSTLGNYGITVNGWEWLGGNRVI